MSAPLTDGPTSSGPFATTATFSGPMSRDAATGTAVLAFLLMREPA